MANGKWLQRQNDTQVNIKSPVTFEKWSPWERKPTNSWAKTNIQHYLLSSFLKC